MAMMNISPNVLRKETLDLIKEIDAELKVITTYLEGGGPASEVADRKATLLQAKATAYNTLVLLQHK